MVVIRQSLDADVVVVGAGPGGATAAFHLARAGHQVLMLDSERFPRDKVCGDFVGPLALAELDALGIGAEPRVQTANGISRATLYLDGRELIRGVIPKVQGLVDYGRAIPRERLDQWLLEAALGAGARLLEGHRVRDFAHDADSLVAIASDRDAIKRVRARLVIGADGSNSITARWLRGYGTPSYDRIVAVRAYYEGVAGPDDEAELYFLNRSFPGYGWLFPTGDGGANVGIGMVGELVPPGKPDLKALLQAMLDDDSALRRRIAKAKLRGRVRGWPLNTYDHRLPTFGDRMLLVGDAAGLINPLNGEGIQYAMQSGRWAAETAIQALEEGHWSRGALGAYGKRLEAELRLDMALSAVIVQLIRNRSLNAIWLKALEIITAKAARDPDYAAVTGGVLAGLVPASHVIGPRVILGTLLEAAQALGLKPLKLGLGHPVRAVQGLLALGSGGFGIAAQAIAHPRDTVDWVRGVADSGTELAGGVLRNWMTSG